MVLALAWLQVRAALLSLVILVQRNREHRYHLLI